MTLSNHSESLIATSPTPSWRWEVQSSTTNTLQGISVTAGPNTQHQSLHTVHDIVEAHCYTVITGK